ncbi:MAG: immunoglobulin domain-containing protein [Sedimentisphaerales bacterium]|nr:immunoglobulin domain-containing protein [Sedimentisphaerales bacterium]
MNRATYYVLFVIFTLSAYSTAAYVPCLPGSGGNIATTAEADIIVTVDYTDNKQQMETFGASDCWTCQYIGNWPVAKKNAIADYLFETGLDENNNPKGAGLSAWRFNLGAGSSRQTYISSVWRRADTFLSTDYNDYDWWRLPGQRWFLQAAKDRGVEHFLAFCNSPPINMTKNGKAFCDSGSGSTNLADDKFDDFAVYLADIMEHFNDEEDITFNYLSPFNEPQWDWEGNSQEGCRYSNEDIRQEVNELYPELQSRGLTTEIMIAEAGSIEYLYTNSSDETGDQIDNFFGTGSSVYIGDKLSNQINSHSYWTDTPDRGLVPKRQSLKSKLDEYPALKYYQSEYCHLNDLGSPRDLGMNPALQMARVMHFDLIIAEAVSWEWWLAVSIYNFNDGLVYVDENLTDGNYYDSKSLWVMGNFSRFIRPGMYRINLSRSDNPTPEDTQTALMMSAYKNTEEQKLVIVIINWTTQQYLIDLNCINLDPGLTINSWIPYVTDADDDLTAYVNIAPTSNIIIPSRSVVTLVSSELEAGDWIYFDKQPQDKYVFAGEDVKFSVGVGPNDPCSYQWYKYINGINDQAIGNDSSVLPINNVQDSNEGSYYCVVTGPLNTIKSEQAKLKIKHLAGYWRLNNDLTDSSGNGWTGDDGGAGYFVSGGIEGQAYEFPGGGHVIIFNDTNQPFNFYPEGLTVNLWVKTTTTANWTAMISKQYREEPWSGWLVGTNLGKPYISLRNVHGNLISDDSINDGLWHILTGIYDPTTGMLKLYVDGRFNTESGPNFTVPATNNEPLVFGAETQTGFVSYTGLLDEVKIFDYPLSPTDVAILYTDFVEDHICAEPPDNDSDNDCDVDLEDFAEFAQIWLTQNDLNNLATFCVEWLDCTMVPDCFE